MNDVKQIVKELNDILFMSTLHEHDYFSYLEYVETPTGDYIKYMGNYLWNSENDHREWVAEDDQEPLEDYLIREVGKISKVLQNSYKVLKENK